MSDKVTRQLEALIRLRVSQQNVLREQLVTLKKQKEFKVEEIQKVEADMASNLESQHQMKIDFYANIKVKIFDYDDVYTLDIDLEKMDRQYDDLVKVKHCHIDELMELEKQIKTTEGELKTLVIEEEKYKYLMQDADFGIQHGTNKH